jgi:hypothetical protein
MNRFHITVVALLLAVAAVAGLLAVTRTHAAATQSTNQAVAARVKQLNAFEAQLRRKLAAAERPQPAAPAAKVVYHRPPPVVVVRHSSHHEDGEGNEHEGGGDD